VSGRAPSGQALAVPAKPASGLVASRFDPSRIEQSARAIAASKRGIATDDPRIDVVWQSYSGQAVAALEASGLQDEVDELALAARWLAQISNGCEETVCADEFGENCLCFERLVGMVRAAGGHLRNDKRAEGEVQ
jgi:hypothetical protein